MPVFDRRSLNTTVPRHSPNTDTTSDSPLLEEASLGDDLIWGADGLARERA
jgi:hypothetical protein